MMRRDQNKFVGFFKPLGNGFVNLSTKGLCVIGGVEMDKWLKK